MSNELRVNDNIIRLMVGFITDIPDMDGIVYYARPDLALGSGFGTAISIQGGPKVQEELRKYGSASVTDVVVTGAGNLKTKHILHAVGPRFQEEDEDTKLKATILNTLKKAQELKLQKIAFPAMGSGFYGIPLDASARLTLGAARDFLDKVTEPKEVVFCLRDNRELKAFQEQLQKM
ncbi:MAG: O-acetyl-ADP-ribose deacetylase [Deltaproteobacteria bacterium HGW-Deltaproteobacteria-12]|jgi:O-acetyl-ADP-ribose deacetylase (regulator of RNase III)|nr:MAG: O-acetyl-ADP-ribose deacetylase [Deltaproteobacteria bacterium HGW-Deltaproteobacteria-12]